MMFNGFNTLVEQWLIIKPKISILKKFVAEQLELGYLEPPTNRHNTLFFLIPNKIWKIFTVTRPQGNMTKWKKMGYAQIDLLHTSTILPRHYIIILDNKDCFFQISLAT